MSEDHEMNGFSHPSPIETNPTNISSTDDDIDSSLMEKIKGDAIGDTLYSERFILKTLMKLNNLTKPLNDDEDYEKDLCTLWDQTVEADVVKFLLTNNVLEIFHLCLTETEDARLIEIIVGIIANMCNQEQTRRELDESSDITVTLISLISHPDSLVLLQLMRFFQAVLMFENNGNEELWYQFFAVVPDFIVNFMNILKNSTSSTLLRHTFDAFYAILLKTVFVGQIIAPGNAKLDFFQPCVVEGIVEGFNQYTQDKLDNEEDDDKLGEFIRNFFDICSTLIQESPSKAGMFDGHLEEIVDCFEKSLRPLCLPNYLFPITPEVQGSFDNLHHILEELKFPWSLKLFKHINTILVMMLKPDSEPSDSENEETDSDTNYKEECIDDLIALLENMVNAAAKNTQHLADFNDELLKEFSATAEKTVNRGHLKELQRVQAALKKIIEQKSGETPV